MLQLLIIIIIIMTSCFSQCGHCHQTTLKNEDVEVEEEMGHKNSTHLNPILRGMLNNTSINTISSKGSTDTSSSTRTSTSSSSKRRDMLTTTRWFNPMDDCWRGNPNWHLNRHKLAECGRGFGSKAKGGKEGPLYVVTNDGDDAQNPAPGTLRYGVIQLKPLWIIFERDMTITLKNELILTRDKTIDGRGANVHIAYGSCITIQGVSNVIIHGLNIHHCKPSPPGRVRSSTAHVGYRQGADGDAISVFGSRNIWIDHNSLYNCQDGLIDVIRGSTDITISNNLFHHHNKVMLLGHNDAFIADKNMRVTIAYNYFVPGCVQRLPRCRLGFFHILQNDYDGWGMYAIEGSASPTILSQGNRFRASGRKEVTKRLSYGWSRWNWRSIDDMFLNGAYFIESGTNGDKARIPSYDQNLIGIGNNGKFLPSYTRDSGSLACSIGHSC